MNTNRSAAGSSLHARGISKTFRLPVPAWRRAASAPQCVLHDVDLDVHAGESVGLIGRTGAGKSTLARVMAGLCPPDAGSVHLEGESLFGSDATRWRAQRRVIRYVFQNPDAMLHPRMTTGQILRDAIQSGHATSGRTDMRSKLGAVQDTFLLSSGWFNRRPAELSLGQRRRVALARSLANNPRYVLLDEPFSGLDQVSKRLLWRSIRNLSESRGTAILLISHDLTSVFALCKRLIVMRDGLLVESLSSGPNGGWDPQHPYARRLFALS